MSRERNDTVRILECLQQATGCYFIWKSTAYLKVDKSLPEQFHRHIHPFCQCVKNISRSSELTCMRNDMQIISRQALKKRRAFINICHAGVAELVIPVFSNGHYRGALLCGLFRQANKASIYPNTSREFLKLEVLSEERINALTEIANRIIQDAEYITHGEHDGNTGVPQPQTIRDKRIANAIRHIQNNFRKEITVDELAEKAALSRSRFLHLFKEQTKMNLSTYIQRLKVEEASHLLSGTDLCMSEIADACGIYDQSRLSVLFKRYFNQSPLNYRKQINRPDA